MSTRYVWKRFTNSTLSQKISWTGELTGGGSGIRVGGPPNETITFCSGFSVKIDDLGKVKYIPSGNIYSYSFGSVEFISSSAYRYCIISNSSRNDDILTPGSRTNYWVVGPSWISGTSGYMVSTSKADGIQDSTAPVSTYKSGILDLEGITTFAYVSSDSLNKYASDNTYSYQYLGSDNIDPLSISYASSIEYQGAGDLTKLPYTISPSATNKYGGTIEYNIEYQKNGGGWVSNTSWISGTTGNRTNFEEGSSYQFRVRARDGWGFTSTTYATGPVCTVTSRLTLSLSASPANAGTVTGSGEYTSGSSVTIKATPANGWEFVGWTEGGAAVSASASYTFTITGSRSLTAVFKQKLTMWAGINNKARKGVELYVGVNGKARKVTAAYIGVNGKARRFL